MNSLPQPMTGYFKKEKEKKTLDSFPWFLSSRHSVLTLWYRKHYLCILMLLVFSKTSHLDSSVHLLQVDQSQQMGKYTIFKIVSMFFWAYLISCSVVSLQVNSQCNVLGSNNNFQKKYAKKKCWKIRWIYK